MDLQSSVEEDDVNVANMDSHWSAITKTNNNQIISSVQDKLKGTDFWNWVGIQLALDQEGWNPEQDSRLLSSLSTVLYSN